MVVLNNRDPEPYLVTAFTDLADLVARRRFVPLAQVQRLTLKVSLQAWLWSNIAPAHDVQMLVARHLFVTNQIDAANPWMVEAWLARASNSDRYAVLDALLGSAS